MGEKMIMVKFAKPRPKKEGGFERRVLVQVDFVFKTAQASLLLDDVIEVRLEVVVKFLRAGDSDGHTGVAGSQG